jgi:hypothetical protein
MNWYKMRVQNYDHIVAILLMDLVSRGGIKPTSRMFPSLIAGRKTLSNPTAVGKLYNRTRKFEHTPKDAARNAGNVNSSFVWAFRNEWNEPTIINKIIRQKKNDR